jgi:hypothetical protein
MKIRDYSHYQRQAELKKQRVAQDALLAERHRNFDLSAQDNHMKYERPSFAVVTASDAFRAGWDAIFNKEKEHGLESTSGLQSGTSKDCSERGGKL